MVFRKMSSNSKENLSINGGLRPFHVIGGRRSNDVSIQGVAGLSNINENRQGEIANTNGNMPGSTESIPVLKPQDKALACTTTIAVILSFLLVILAGVGFLFLFSYMEFQDGSDLFMGDRVYVTLSTHQNSTTTIFIVCLCSLAVLYIVDIANWLGSNIVISFLAAVLILGTLFLACLTALLATKSYAVAPLMLYVIILVTATMLIKGHLFSGVDIIVFLNGLLAGLIVVFGISLGLWGYFVLGDQNYWDNRIRSLYFERLECSCPDNSSEVYQVFMSLDNTTDLMYNETSLYCLNVENFTHSTEYTEICSRAYIVWVAPFILSCFTFSFSFILFFLVRAENTRRTMNLDGIRVDPMAQFFILFLTLCMLGLWIGASIASATTNAADIIVAFSTLGFIISLMLAWALFGMDKLEQEVKKTPLGEKFDEFRHSDWGRALLLIVLLPVIVFYGVMSFLKQSFKTFASSCCGMGLDPTEKGAILTPRGTRFFKRIWCWEWGSVIVKSLWWGIIFFTMVVGVARITTVFLSYLREQLMDYSLATTTGIFVAVGVFLFLLPPVPGVPVYVSGGIILTSAAEEKMTFLGGVFYTIAICLLLKLFAVTLQQKMIGEAFGSKSVRIRYLVGINSVELRAMRKVLSQAGLCFDKVVILIGGPDWPTSVLTGIMRLPLVPMLIGTLPVVFLIAPCCVAGSMLVKASEGGIYSSLSTISILIAFLVQSGALLAAAHYIAKMAVAHKDELAAETPDAEVLRLEQNSARKRKIRSDMQSWAPVPMSSESQGTGGLHPIWRAGHVICLILMSASSYCFQLLGSSCFVTFDVTDSIDEKLDGNILNLVTDFGKYPCYAFLFATSYLILYSLILGQVVSRSMDFQVQGTYNSHNNMQISNQIVYS